MYHSFVAILYSTLSLISYSTLVQALPANGDRHVYPRETDIGYYGTVHPTETALAAEAPATSTTTSTARSFPMAATLGVIIGGVVLLFASIGLITCYCRRRNSNKRDTLVLKVDEPTNEEIAREAMTRKATTSTSSSESGRGTTSQGSLHTINVVSPISSRSPPAANPIPDSRRSFGLPTNPRQSIYTPNPYGRTQPPPGFQPPAVPPVPMIVASSPPEEGRSFISRPITLLPPVPQVLPAGRPQMTQADLPGNTRHYMLQSGTIGRQAHPGNDAGYYGRNNVNQPRNVPNRRETLRDDTVASAFGLGVSPTVLSESPQSMLGEPLRRTETAFPSGRR